MRLDVHFNKPRAQPQFVSWVVNSLNVKFGHTLFFFDEKLYPPRFAMWLKQLRSRKRKMSPLIQQLLEEYYWKKVEYTRKKRSGEEIHDEDIPEYEGLVFSRLVLALLLRHYNESVAERARVKEALLEESRKEKEKMMQNIWGPSLPNEFDEL